MKLSFGIDCGKELITCSAQHDQLLLVGVGVRVNRLYFERPHDWIVAPRKEIYPSLYVLSLDKNSTIVDLWNNGKMTLNLRMRRNLKENEVDDWATLSLILPNGGFTNRDDIWLWNLDPAGFSS